MIVQPDGTLTLLAVWMTSAASAGATVTMQPVIAIGRLVELRALLDSVLTSLPGESAPPRGAT